MMPCAQCCCPNRAWRIAGHTYEKTGSTAISGATLESIVNGYDFTGKEPGFYGEVSMIGGTVAEYPLAGVTTLKIQNHEWDVFDGYPTLSVDHTRFTKAAGWFRPSGHHYWKTIIEKVGQHVCPRGDTFGIFSDPVQTRVECTPNEIIEFGVPPLGETWIISDCEDDYTYNKMPRDLELCLRACVGDSSTIWAALCITSFQTTPEEVAEISCAYAVKKEISGCIGDHSPHGRRGKNSIWDC